jgi:hypothetical protein
MDYEVTSWCRLPSVTNTAASAEDGDGAESSSHEDLEPSEIAAASSEIPLQLADPLRPQSEALANILVGGAFGGVLFGGLAGGAALVFCP